MTKDNSFSQTKDQKRQDIPASSDNEDILWCSECNGEDEASVCKWCYQNAINKLQETE